jgi:hypothetical protein
MQAPPVVKNDFEKIVDNVKEYERALESAKAIAEVEQLKDFYHLFSEFDVEQAIDEMNILLAPNGMFVPGGVLNAGWRGGVDAPLRQRAETMLHALVPIRDDIEATLIITDTSIFKKYERYSALYRLFESYVAAVNDEKESDLNLQECIHNTARLLDVLPFVPEFRDADEKNIDGGIRWTHNQKEIHNNVKNILQHLRGVQHATEQAALAFETFERCEFELASEEGLSDLDLGQAISDVASLLPKRIRSVPMWKGASDDEKKRIRKRIIAVRSKLREVKKQLKSN